VPSSSGGGANTGAPKLSETLRAARSCHGFVRTMTVSRSAARSSIGAGGVVGSIRSNRLAVVDRV